MNIKEKIKIVITEKLAIRLIGFSVFCFIVSVTIFSWKRETFSFSNPIDAGLLDNFGSFISGFIGSILSLASSILVYVALTEQRKATSDIKKEQEDIEKTQRYQRFENTFFQLLNFHNQIVNAMSVTIDKDRQKYTSSQNPSHEYFTESVKYTGRDYFKYFYEELPQLVELNKKYNEKISVKTIYEYAFGAERGQLGHYFRHLYHIVKFIDKSDIEEKDKRTYSSLIRAQLSSYELVLLHYNGLSAYGFEKFKPLIEKYDLLQNMDEDLIIKDIVSEVYGV